MNGINASTFLISDRTFPGSWIIIGLMLLLIGSFCCQPALAVPFPYGEPVFSATIIGDDELKPGSAEPLIIEIANVGHNPEKILDPVDPVISSPVIAIGTKLTLYPGDSPLDIVSTPFTIPILPPSVRVPVVFPVIVPEFAHEGKYDLVLAINSSYVDSIAIQGTGTNVYHYQIQNLTLKVPVTIKGVVSTKVEDIRTSNLSSGQDGRIIANITNTGQYTGKYATAAIVTSQNSPLSIYQGSYFLGEFKPGETRKVVWRAQLKDNIDSTNLPAALVISYEDKNGLLTKSMPVALGIPVSTGPKFDLIYEKPSIEPSGSTEVKIQYRNIGDKIASNAVAKIVPISPVSSDVTSAILGDILPGESAEVVYQFKLGSKALVKPYSVLTDVKYRGEDGMIVVSEPMQIELNTVPQSVISMLMSPVSLVVVISILLILGYLVMKRKGRMVLS